MRQADMQGPFHEQAIEALMRMDNGPQNYLSGLRNGDNKPKLRIEEQRSAPVGTWARVASAPANMGAIEYMAPPMSTGPFLRSSIPLRTTSGNNTASPVVRGSNGITLGGLPSYLPSTGGNVVSSSCQELEPKAALIRIFGKIGKDFIQFLTSRIHEGPLYDIKIESVHSARVTFQQAAHGLAFLKSHEDMEKMLRFGRLGAGYHIELAELTEWNEFHRMMNQPIRERRRLSFARKKLFTEGTSPDTWKQDVRTLAGPGNIDFLWVFNSGNGEFDCLVQSTCLFF